MYASHGWPVLACYTNTKTGCSCGESRCLSPGKHPRTDISPRGVLSATTDLDEISKWSLDINVGIALGHQNVMALDVDDSEVAEALLLPESPLRTETGLSRTGRGAHVFFICHGDKRTRHLRNKLTGRKIGELRGINAYVIAPPSRAPAGKRYKWVSPLSDSGLPKLAETADAFKYAQSILKPLGIRAAETAGFSFEDVPDEVDVEERDLPKLIAHDNDLLDIRMKLRGEFKTQEERSDWEHHDACSILRALKAHSVKRFSAMRLAGIIKKLDRTYYRKFEDDVVQGKRSRKAADYRYYVAANRALDAEGMDQPKPHDSKLSSDPIVIEDDDEAEAVGINDEPTYIWDEETGRLYFHVRHKKSSTNHRIANFNVKLTREILFDKDEVDPERAWVVRMMLKDGRSVDVPLLARQYDSDRAIEAALTRLLPYDYNIQKGAYGHLKPAIRELSGDDVDRETIRALPGWWEPSGAKRVFLLPGALGAIGHGKVDTSLRMRVEELRAFDDPTARPEFAPYGKGVRPAVSREERVRAWKAFRALVHCADASITMPVILQILTGPLWTAGADEVPPLLHVMGKTGALKTSFCLAAMSIFGTFRKTTPPTASWLSASPAALRTLLHNAKDLTLLIDDYKTGSHYDQAGMRALVQDYANKSARQRLRSSGEQRKSLEMRGAILSNGEDRWDREASMVARTIFLEIKNGDIVDERLTEAQDAVDRGELQIFGGEFLSWLSMQDELFEKREMEEIRERWLRKLQKRASRSDMHRRLLASASTVAAVGTIFLRFVKAKYPSRLAEAKEWTKASREFLLSGSRERAEEVDRLAGLQQLLSYVAEQTARGAACFMPVNGIDQHHSRLPDNPQAEIIGWYSYVKVWKDGRRVRNRVLHLGEYSTWSWYEQQMRKQGRELHFSWNAVRQEATSKFSLLGARAQTIRVTTPGRKDRRQVRVITLPLEALNDAAIAKQPKKKS